MPTAAELPELPICMVPRLLGATPSSALVTAVLPDALPESGPRRCVPCPPSARPGAMICVTRPSIIAPHSAMVSAGVPAPPHELHHEYRAPAAELVARPVCPSYDRMVFLPSTIVSRCTGRDQRR